MLFANSFRALACIAACLTASAAEIHISFGALERVLSAQMFTDEGRRYVRGSRTDKCNYAWLEQPRIENAGGRLRIGAKFTGRTSVDLFGRCIGLGDSFAVRIEATPFYSGGHVGLKDVRATPEGGGSFYANRVCSSLAASLQRDFRYPLAAEAKKGLEDAGSLPEYPRQLRRFEVTSMRVTGEALVLAIDFEVLVR